MIIPADATQRIMKRINVSYEDNFDEKSLTKDFGSIADINNLMKSLSIVNMTTTTREDRKDKIGVEVWLSPDLEAKIIDNTLGEAASVFSSAMRRR